MPTKKTGNAIWRRLGVLLLAGTVLGAPAGCSGVAGRYDHARDIAATARMQPARINADPFVLSGFSRITAPGQPATVYIEGDGLAWLSRQTPSLDPSPKNPVALKLAALDTAANVIYLSRPCQYTKLVSDAPCPMKYWTSHRFAPEVIAGTNTALDRLKQQHGFVGIHLVGFSGGAAVAAYLAAQRDDVISLRSRRITPQTETRHRKSPRRMTGGFLCW